MFVVWYASIASLALLLRLLSLLMAINRTPDLSVGFLYTSLRKYLTYLYKSWSYINGTSIALAFVKW